MNNGVLVQSQNSLIVPLGLVSYWSFNDGAGSAALDFGGLGKTGKLEGSASFAVPSWVNGRVGSALRFNRRNYVSASYTDTIASSYAAWIYLDGTPLAYDCVIAKNETATRYFTILLKVDRRLAMYAYATANVSYDNGTSGVIPLKTWTHVALTYNSSDGLRGYVNGVQDGTAAANGNLAVGSTFLTIGSYYPNYVNGDRFFSGSIDDVRVYNRVLTNSEVKLLYAARPA